MTGRSPRTCGGLTRRRSLRPSRSTRKRSLALTSWGVAVSVRALGEWGWLSAVVRLIAKSAWSGRRSLSALALVGSAADAAVVRCGLDPCGDDWPRRRVLVQRGQRHGGRRCLRHRQQRHDVEHDVVGVREVRRSALLQRHERARQRPELGVPAADDGDDARGVGRPVHRRSTPGATSSTRATTTTTSKPHPATPASQTPA